MVPPQYQVCYTEECTKVAQVEVREKKFRFIYVPFIQTSIPTPISKTKKDLPLLHIVLWLNVVPLLVCLILLCLCILKLILIESVLSVCRIFVGRRKHVLISFSLSPIELILFLP